eukprot:scaffold10209_cov116-Skeletonema_dohrnii-CCMP3373.AAC.2
MARYIKCFILHHTITQLLVGTPTLYPQLRRSPILSLPLTKVKNEVESIIAHHLPSRRQHHVGTTKVCRLLRCTMAVDGSAI